MCPSSPNMFWICWPVPTQFDRGGEISVVIAFPHPRRGTKKSLLTLLLRRGLVLGVTEPTQETHWKMCFVISIAQGTAWFSRSRQPDIPRFVQVVGEHRSIVWQWWPPVSIPFSSTREDISSFPGTTHCFFHPGRKRVGQGRGTKALGSCRKPAFYCSQGRKLFPALGASKCSAAGATGWGGTVGWELCSSVLRGSDAVESWQGCGRHINI